MEVSEHMSEQSTETCLTTNKLLYIAFEESGLNQNVYSQSNEAKQTVAPKKKAVPSEEQGRPNKGSLR